MKSPESVQPGAGKIIKTVKERSTSETGKAETHPEKQDETLGAFRTRNAQVILFTGHMVDGENRPEPRFPSHMEEVARVAIKEAVKKVKESTLNPVIGIAGGACGGDILFHEVCANVGIPTEIYLALPPDQFLNKSVKFAGPQWVERFNQLIKTQPVKVLDTSALPIREEQTIWVQTNLWMLQHAIARGGEHLTLIAFWDGKGGDGIGGTEHMMHLAKEKGAGVVWIDTRELFGFNE